MELVADLFMVDDYRFGTSTATMYDCDLDFQRGVGWKAKTAINTSLLF